MEEPGARILAASAVAGSTGREEIEAAVRRLPLYFVENRGQIDSRVSYYVQGKDTSVYFTREGLTFALVDRLEKKRRWGLKLDFLGAHGNVEPTAVDETAALVNYFKGDRSDWKMGLRTYHQVAYRELWPGVDLKYAGDGGRLKSTFVVKPGADPSVIRLGYRGVTSLAVTGEGRLSVETPVGGFEEDRPIAYQEDNGAHVEIPVAFELDPERNQYGFRLGPYDRSRPLILDPVILTYCGYLGGSSEDDGISIAVDSSGNAYLTGYTSSTEADFPVVAGPDTTYNGSLYDAFVAKLNSTGTALVYCGYIGGVGNDYGQGIAVDTGGNAYIVGTTYSSDATFPEIVGPDLTSSGVPDAFVAKVNSSGSLVYCGFIGGSGLETGGAITVDSSGSAYVVGSTGSTPASFPETVGPDLTFNGGTTDGFVAMVNAAGTAFVYCGYLGGTGDDYANGVAVDGSGSAYVAGQTSSTEASFPETVGPDLTYNGGPFDGFVAKVNTTGAALTYCGYIGGSSGDVADAIAVDGSGNAYVAGSTSSTEASFPETTGPDLTSNGGSDAFVAEVNSAGTALSYCGYVGGSGSDSANGIALDPSGNAYIAGYTSSNETTFPVIRGPDLTFNGVNDVFVAKVAAGGAQLSYCGYIGGSGDDNTGAGIDPGNAIAVDTAGSAYVIGITASSETSFPAHAAFDLTYAGGTYDSFFAKIDDTGGTAVKLSNLTASAYDGQVVLEWQTASELDNLGFHVYRSFSAGGPYERLNSSLIPGLGSSPVGASYQYQDTGLTNGQTYFYRLEDVETTGKTAVHGPVQATPDFSLSSPASTGSGLTYGDPASVTARVLDRTARGLTLELRTAGLTASAQDDGSVRLEIPGFVNERETASLAVPVWRSWIEVEAGRGVEIAWVREGETEVFDSLRPSELDAPQIVASRDTTVRLARAKAARAGRSETHEETARILELAYQGEVKKALVELSPLRWDGRKLWLSRILRVRLSFPRRAIREEAFDDGRGRRHRETGSHRRVGVLRRILTTEKGIYAASFEEIFGSSAPPIEASKLRLSRLGEAVAFHLEPENDRFAPGSVLYFWSEGASLNPYGEQAVYELELAPRLEMPVAGARSGGPQLVSYWQTLDREENHYYQAGLLEAPDRWLWDLLFAPAKKSYPFEVSELASDGAIPRLEVWLQGVSELSPSPDHHLRLYVNGAQVAEILLAGKNAERTAVDLPPGALREGWNELAVENVGDTGALYSMVMLDRFRLTYPRRLQGEMEGTFSESGVVDVSNLSAETVGMDLTEKPERWIEMGPAPRQASVTAGHRYAFVDPSSIRKPIVRASKASSLKNRLNRADYLLLGPSGLLTSALPLCESRKRQGLRCRAVSLEEIYSEFGFGEERPEAIRDFLSYVYHHWQRPSVRYVLLVGDGTYDFKGYLPVDPRNQVPPLLVKTTFLWTASDPTYAAVNGDDSLPDLAIGRLPGSSPEEVRVMVDKILGYERAGTDTRGPVVLVADDADEAGNFEAGAEELAGGVLAPWNPRKIYLERLGVAETRSAIAESFDEGAALVSYVGHGGITLWAAENIFDDTAVAPLAPQPQQPLVLTLNCLNGYFHFPYGDSLAEALLKAKDRGAVAVVSPSGLSLENPARLLHQALLRALVEKENMRLGDAMLEAQAEYASTGAFPELLTIYHLFGDPAMKIHESRSAALPPRR